MVKGSMTYADWPPRTALNMNIQHSTLWLVSQWISDTIGYWTALNRNIQQSTLWLVSQWISHMTGYWTALTTNIQHKTLWLVSQWVSDMIGCWTALNRNIQHSTLWVVNKLKHIPKDLVCYRHKNFYHFRSLLHGRLVSNLKEYLYRSVNHHVSQRQRIYTPLYYTKSKDCLPPGKNAAKFTDPKLNPKPPFWNP